jgi:uncharacterized membrane protein
MNINLSQKMTLLGLCAVAFYGLMLATGQATLEVMPQFVVSALVFLFSGRIMRMAGARSSEKVKDEQQDDEAGATEEDWGRLTLLLNWGAVFTIITVLALWILTPPDATLGEFVKESFVNQDVHKVIIAP